MKVNEYLNGNRWNGKRYDDSNNNIVYELKNGNGFIKEYNNGKLIFEAEYLNGNRWNGKGKGLKYNNIVYELKNGKGFIKEYNYNNELVFEGNI